MGNTSVKEDEKDKVTWKTGSIDSSIPIYVDSLSTLKSYENLKRNPELRQLILRNLDCDDLINALMPKNWEDSVALKGISCYQTLNPDELAILKKDIQNLENAVTAGIPVSVLCLCFSFLLFSHTR